MTTATNTVTQLVGFDSQGAVTKVLKRQPGLGKLNRLTKSVQETLVAKGHANKRFKRNYANGVALYTCPTCKLTATAQVSQERGKSFVGGDALENTCKVANS